VLETLAHELVHATGAAGHRRAFARVAGRVGLIEPWKEAPAGPALRATLTSLAEELGPYPHAALMTLTKERPQKGRQRLWECACGKPVKIRAASDTLAVLCLVCLQPFKLKTKEEGS
jgi:hypothetical protein